MARPQCRHHLPVFPVPLKVPLRIQVKDEDAAADEAPVNVAEGVLQLGGFKDVIEAVKGGKHNIVD